jgi:hypothetical protein
MQSRESAFFAPFGTATHRLVPFGLRQASRDMDAQLHTNRSAATLETGSNRWIKVDMTTANGEDRLLRHADT